MALDVAVRGHHLALNLTISGDAGILRPSLTAAQPALYTLNGATVRPVGKESDKAFALLAALKDEQRKQAVLNYRVSDLVLGPGKDGKTIEPEGLKASAMTGSQRALFLDVISEWAGIVHDGAAAERMAETDDGDAGAEWDGVLPDSRAEAGDRVRAAAHRRRCEFAC